MKKPILAVIGLIAGSALCAAGEFVFREIGATSLEVSEDGRPVIVYNYGTLLRDGVSES